ncbi:hypothetical protein C8J56DRAFT_1105421 [Mycena floridula]|nr:hypothetical protein C8J56DRAFT_1105421 [Mycena floridula]
MSNFQSPIPVVFNVQRSTLMASTRVVNLSQSEPSSYVEITAIPQHLLMTNDTPLAVEEQSLRRLLQAMTRSVEFLRLSEEQAADELEVLQDRIFLIQGILSAARRIPPEIIGEMVLHALEFYGPRDRRKATSLDTRKGIWIYAQVSRIWRAATFAIPAAWACLDIRMPIDKSQFHSSSPEILAMILSRARSHPLQIRMKLPSGSDIEKQLLKLVVSQSSRWQDVSLDMAVKHFAGLRRVKGRLPMLESISLLPVSYRRISSSTKSFAECFKVAPALRRITLRNFDPTTLTIPWDQIEITQYHMNRHMTSDILHFLPNLSSFHIESGSLLQLLAPVMLPRLASFHYTSGCVDDFRRLAVPNLKTFECPIWRFAPNADVIDMLAQCSLLETLLLTDIREEKLEQENEDLAPFFQRIPLLTCLSLSTISLTRIIHLELQDGQPFILPNLQLLILPLRLAQRSQDIVKMVRSRWSIPDTLKGLVQPLEELRFVYSSSPSADMMADYALFDCFRDEGLLVTMTSDYLP